MELLVQMICGDEELEKFNKIYDTYSESMYLMAKAILKDEYLAEDVLQETFIFIAQMKNLNKIQNIDSCETRAFLTMIVRNIALNAYKKRKRKKETPITEFNEDILTDTERNGNYYNSVEKSCSEKLEYCLKKLPKAYMDVLYLRYVYEYSTYEVAKIFNISESAVRKRISRAKAKVKKIYENKYKTKMDRNSFFDEEQL